MKGYFFKHRRKGMLLVLVAGVLVFSMIIFISLINRVRHEGAVTARVSVNERMYQAASAIGRLAVRKLQKDFETKDPEFSKKIIDAAFNNKYGKLAEVSYSDVIKNLDVVKEIITRFKSKWGEISFEVTYSTDLGKENPFSAPIKGLTPSPFERKGHIDVVVEVFHLGISKVCRIRKEFLLTNLLPQPFHRFTLFSHKGATIDKNVANQTFLKDDGKLESGRPLVCYNSLIRKKKEGIEGLDFRFNRADNIVKVIDGEPSFVKNGWIYLGGRGNSMDSMDDSGNLILNVNTGSNDDQGKSCFGEFFHFYFNPNSSGWLISKDWTDWFNKLIPGNDQGGGASRIMVAFVDYGYYKGLYSIPFRSNYLFKTALEIYGSKISENIDRGNSMHLFGTPALCTPTLIFGKVKRRYIRTFAFYFSESSRVYPLRGFKNESSLNNFAFKEIPDWYRSISGNNADETLMADFSSIFATEIDVPKYQLGFPSKTPSLCGLDPEVRDWEPYLEGLKNISDPGGPDRKWSEVVMKNDYVQDGPQSLCKTDYNFSNDKEIYYTGSIRQINPKDGYLRDRMSYLIDTGENGPVKLSKCEFFKNRFISKSKGKNMLFLNQVIGIKGDLIVDIPLEVVKGGVIIVDGKVTIQAPIVNPYIENVPTTPDAYGYLSFITKKEIVIAAGTKVSGGLPQVHGFFISMSDGGGRIVVGKGFHIIGGVAADNIDDLVKNGCIVEWGFDPKELSNGKCFSSPDFYGLAMGPRDLEIIREE